jgi:hypothetical protein
MKGSKAEQNILETILTISSMVMENMYGLMERYIKEIGLRVKRVGMGSGRGRILRTRANGIMGS